MSGGAPPRDPFYASPFGPFYRRHAPCAVQPDYRMHELNKRLQSRTEDCDILWWDAFCTEFFEEDATLTLSFCLEEGPKTYTIGRALIPRFFSTLFEGGVYELFFELKHTKESFNNSTITVDCHQCTMVTQHGKPTFAKVCTEGRLILVFTFDDLMRIKTWHFTISHYSELIPRSVLAVHAQDPGALEQLSKNISRVGLSNLTLNYLRLCMILEPMQELMSRHKTYGLSPRDCLKTCLFHQWQRMTTPPVGPSPSFKTEIFQSNPKKEPAKPTAKRRRRRNSAGSASGNTTGNSKKRSPANSFSLPTQDVMMVGEPSLMGGDVGGVDERLITRLENEQYDPTNGLHDDDLHDYANSQALSNGSPWNGQPPGNQDSQPDTMATQPLE
ncbi:LIM domain-binding protein 2b isoform X2 [Astyanax mexicanus]|uniref:LIM domain-binding protein 2b isoform X2 n=1 Tax=Astyanax mexicanus TaxID=7994 RepID=UPI000BBD5257|nr:LIM domain-binding protein 2b isoform X2 [Astyanax mexicanus]